MIRTEAVILAAGASSRMGQPKPYLQIGGKSFLGMIDENLRKAGFGGRIVCVINPEHLELSTRLKLPGWEFVLNPDTELGQIHSLKLGLEKISKEADRMLMCLADHPFVKAETYRQLLEAAETDSEEKGIIIPVYKDRKGHPIILPKVYFSEIRELPAAKPGGLKNIINEHQYMILKIEVNDPGVRGDMDTPEDLQKFMKLK